MTTTAHARDPSHSTLMLDHPGWTIDSHGRAQRAFRSGDPTGVLTCDLIDTTAAPTLEIVHPTTAATDTRPVIDTYDPATLPWPFCRAHPLRTMGRRHRVRNPDLWDAMLLPLLRRYQRARDAAHLYRNFCTRHGEHVTTQTGATLLLAPTAATVAQLDDAAFTATGAGQVASTLRRAGEMFLEHHLEWTRYPPEHLFQAVQATPHVGPWCAATIVADHTGDFSFFPHVDFGSHGRWEQFAADIGGGTAAGDFAFTWNNLTRNQRSTLTALSTHWNTTTQTDATNRPNREIDSHRPHPTVLAG